MIRGIKRLIRNVYRNRAIWPKQLSKKKWYDFDYQMLYVNMEMLTRFVEEEKSHMMFISHNEISKPKTREEKRQLGLAYLDWEIGLGLDGEKVQSDAAKEIKLIYWWWNDKYPKRIDPYENKYYKEYRKMKKKRDLELYGSSIEKDKDTEERKKVYEKARNLSSELEERYYNEEQDMLIRLMKIRGSLWT